MPMSLKILWSCNTNWSNNIFREVKPWILSVLVKHSSFACSGLHPCMLVSCSRVARGFKHGQLWKILFEHIWNVWLREMEGVLGGGVRLTNIYAGWGQHTSHMLDPNNASLCTYIPFKSPNNLCASWYSVLCLLRQVPSCHQHPHSSPQVSMRVWTDLYQDMSVRVHRQVHSIHVQITDRNPRCSPDQRLLHASSSYCPNSSCTNVMRLLMVIPSAAQALLSWNDPPLLSLTATIMSCPHTPWSTLVLMTADGVSIFGALCVGQRPQSPNNPRAISSPDRCGLYTRLNHSSPYIHGSIHPRVINTKVHVQQAVNSRVKIEHHRARCKANKSLNRQSRAVGPSTLVVTNCWGFVIIHLRLKLLCLCVWID